VVCGRDEIRSEDEKKLEASLPKVVIAQGKMLDAKRAAESPTPPHAASVLVELSRIWKISHDPNAHQ